jgi:hypothetical protein
MLHSAVRDPKFKRRLKAYTERILSSAFVYRVRPSAMSTRPRERRRAGGQLHTDKNKTKGEKGPSDLKRQCREHPQGTARATRTRRAEHPSRASTRYQGRANVGAPRAIPHCAGQQSRSSRSAATHQGSSRRACGGSSSHRSSVLPRNKLVSAT